MTSQNDVRSAISAGIENLIDILDILDIFEGCTDLEPDLGSVERIDQSAWAISETSDREEENEHGGDVQDEPHDEETDCDDEDNGEGDQRSEDEPIFPRVHRDLAAEAAAAREACVRLDSILARLRSVSPTSFRLVAL